MISIRAALGLPSVLILPLPGLTSQFPEILSSKDFSAPPPAYFQGHSWILASPGTASPTWSLHYQPLFLQLLYFLPPVFPHSPSETLNLIIPCLATCDPPFPCSSPSRHLCLSSLRLQMNPSVASTLSPLPFPSTYLLDKCWSQWSQRAAASGTPFGPQAWASEATASSRLHFPSHKLLWRRATSPLLDRPYQQATNMRNVSHVKKKNTTLDPPNPPTPALFI